MFPVTIRRISVIVFVALSILLSATNLFNLIQNRNTAPDDVSKWENRLQPIKEKLPAAATEVGYLADEDLRNELPTNGELVELYLTQYTLSPVIVRRGSEYAWIIGNFSAKNFEGWLQASIGAYELQDLGSGIYLIHRAEK